MSDGQTTPSSLRSFNPRAMLENISCVRAMIKSIRQKDGGIGSVEDELSLHRVIYDLDLLIDIVDGLKAAYNKLEQEKTVVDAQLVSLKQTYEKMLQRRQDRIKDLEEELDNKA